MAELDYLFLADFAKVEPSGTLTVVGASWTVLRVQSFPAMHMLGIAGRVRLHAGDAPAPGRLLIEGPDESVSLNLEITIEADQNARVYGDNRVGSLFAVNLPVPIVKAGLHWVRLELEGQTVRSLAFEAVQADR